jgi:hypothetical protein
MAGAAISELIVRMKKIFIALGLLACVGILGAIILYQLQDTVRVIDARTSQPIANAEVMPIYPSFTSPPYTTNKRGVARIGGFGIPASGSGSIQISATGYATNLVSAYPPRGGWTGTRIDIALEPITK